MQVERERIVDSIADFRKKVNQQLEELQHNTDQVLDEKFTLQETHLNSEMEKINGRLDRIDDYLNETSKLKRSECELYVRFMAGKHLIEELENEFTVMKKRKRRPSIMFVLDKKLEKMFGGLVVLGNVVAQWDMKYLQAL